MKKNALIATLLALAVSTPMMTVVSAAEEHEHAAGKVTIPETLSGVWHEIKEHEEELGKTITDKKLEKVHEIAFEIRDLVNALPTSHRPLTPGIWQRSRPTPNSWWRSQPAWMNPAIPKTRPQPRRTSRNSNRF